MALKRTSTISSLLRKSPFTPIQEHMAAVFSCICTLPPLFEALFSENREETLKVAKQMRVLENEAERIKNTFCLNMPRTLLLPVDRDDLLGLISDQDRLADTCEEIGKIFSYRNMSVPGILKEHLDELLEGTVEICGEAKRMIEELDELLELGFGGTKETAKISAMIHGVRKSEHNIDQIMDRSRRDLFTIEKEMSPVDVMFCYKIIELVGNISDQAENIADRLLLFLSR